MDKFLYYPVKPYKLNQGFGENPAYYAKFGWKGHNGYDLFAPHATPLYAPCDGDAFYTTDAHGGAGIWIRVPNNGATEYNVILWHLCTREDPVYHPLIPSDGSVVSVKAGALIGYTDNSGAPYESSGDHLHLGLMPCDKTSEALDPNNGYGGCIDPAPFLNGIYAQDIEEIEKGIQASEQLVQIVAQNQNVLPKSQLQILLSKVAEFLTSIFK